MTSSRRLSLLLWDINLAVHSILLSSLMSCIKYSVNPSSYTFLIKVLLGKRIEDGDMVKKLG